MDLYININKKYLYSIALYQYKTGKFIIIINRNIILFIYMQNYTYQ